MHASLLLVQELDPSDYGLPPPDMVLLSLRFDTARLHGPLKEGVQDVISAHEGAKLRFEWEDEAERVLESAAQVRHYGSKCYCC